MSLPLDQFNLFRIADIVEETMLPPYSSPVHLTHPVVDRRHSFRLTVC